MLQSKILEALGPTMIVREEVAEDFSAITACLVARPAPSVKRNNASRRVHTMEPLNQYGHLQAEPQTL